MLNPLRAGPLTDAEQERLRDLLDRSDRSLPIDALDGLFAALVCSPILVPPSGWFPMVWDGEGPEWESLEEAQLFHGLIMRMWNETAKTINDGTYSMLVTVETDEAGNQFVFPQAWCQGFFSGMQVHDDLWWDARRSEVMELIKPIKAIVADQVMRASKKRLKGFKKLSLEEYNELSLEISENVVMLREYWLEHPVPQPSQRPTTRSSPKVGRNDPCPCGSGKKFKHCHGAAGPVH